MATNEGARPRSAVLLALIPALAFAGLAAVFLVGLSNDDPSRLPSALIDKPVPAFSLAPLEGLKEKGEPVAGFGSADLNGGDVTLVNVWASWCVPCRQEHPVLEALATRHGLTVLGINYKDDPEDARRFLGLLGNPYKAVGVDRDGRTAIDWGVSGVPETFIIDGTGHIRHKHTGPLSPAKIESDILPVVRRLKEIAATQN